MDRDGEVFLQLFNTNDGVKVRFIEPGCVFRPQSQSANKNATFGVLTDPDDVETVQAYYVDEQEIPADQIQHRKANVDVNVKRGRPTFYSIRKELRRAVNILENMGATCDVQSRIAMIRRHVSGTRAGLQNMQATNAQLTFTNPLTKQRESVNQYPKGAIIDAGSNTEYDFPSGGVNVENWVAAVQAQLRAAASRLVMPEFMFTADASNANYSSTMVAEGPAVRQFEKLQGRQKEQDLEILYRSLQLAVNVGRITQDMLDRCEIQVGMPTLMVRDMLQEAQANEIAFAAKVLSPQTWRGKVGLDDDQENQNWQKWNAENQQPGDTPTQTGDQGRQPGQPGPGDAPPPSQQPGQGDAGVQTELTLNGAQIDAARNVLLDIQLGRIAASAAIELLVAVGIPRDRSITIVQAQFQIPAPAPPETVAKPAAADVATRESLDAANAEARAASWRGYPLG